MSENEKISLLDLKHWCQYFILSDDATSIGILGEVNPTSLLGIRMHYTEDQKGGLFMDLECVVVDCEALQAGINLGILDLTASFSKAYEHALKHKCH